MVLLLLALRRSHRSSRPIQAAVAGESDWVFSGVSYGSIRQTHRIVEVGHCHGNDLIKPLPLPAGILESQLCFYRPLFCENENVLGDSCRIQWQPDKWDPQYRSHDLSHDDGHDQLFAKWWRCANNLIYRDDERFSGWHGGFRWWGRWFRFFFEAALATKGVIIELLGLGNPWGDIVWDNKHDQH